MNTTTQAELPQQKETTQHKQRTFIPYPMSKPTMKYARTATRTFTINRTKFTTSNQNTDETKTKKCRELPQGPHEGTPNLHGILTAIH